LVDFELSEEQQQLRDLAHEFAEKEVSPRAPHHDQTGEFPMEICRQAWEIGLMNTHIPEAYGGPGLGVFEGALITEEIAWGCTGVSAAMEANSLAEAPVIVAGTDEQKKAWLAPMTEEFKLAAYAVTEPDAGSDVAGIKSVARRVGDDYVLTGNKMWITGAAPADWYFVLALTDPEKRHRGMGAFLVSRSSDGVEVGKKEKNMGQRASDTRAITFHEVKVPAGNRLGNEGDGWKIAMAAFDHTRPIISAAAVGLARSAFEHSVRYARERKAFGKPIAALQAVAFMIAEMAMNIEAARLLVWKACRTVDQGRRNTLEAAFAKAFAADMAMKTALDAVQVYGGYGFNAEYPVEKLMRDAKVYQIYEGTSQIQRVVIAKEIFDRG
jgi:acyl-CoA dehydrogenase